MISLDQLRLLYPRASDAVLTPFAAQAQDLGDRFGLTAVTARKEFFLAQIGHESGGLTVIEEGLGYSAGRLMQVWPARFPTLAAAQPYAGNPQKLANFVYAGRMGNGNVASGDGYSYRGRGLIQITGRDCYRSVGANAAIDLEGSPDLATTAADLLLVACGFWKWKGINAACDRGDFAATTKLINGGLVGQPDRLAWLDKVRKVLATPLVPAHEDQPSPATVRAVQAALRLRGYAGIGAADGQIGPKTAAAISQFRASVGLSPGGIDDALLKVLEIDD